MLTDSNDKRQASPSDEQLVTEALQGNGDAFTELVSRCAPMIQQQAAKLRSAWIDSEDLAQEGLWALYSATQTYSEHRNARFRTYAFVCIRNRMLTAVQKCSQAPTSLVGDSRDLAEECSEFDNDPVTPENLVVRREEAARLNQRIRKILSGLEYQVLMLHLGAYSYDEISHKLQISVKAVDNALQRIRKKLSRMSWLEQTS